MSVDEIASITELQNEVKIHYRFLLDLLPNLDVSKALEVRSMDIQCLCEVFPEIVFFEF